MQKSCFEVSDRTNRDNYKTKTDEASKYRNLFCLLFHYLIELILAFAEFMLDVLRWDLATSDVIMIDCDFQPKTKTKHPYYTFPFNDSKKLL